MPRLTLTVVALLAVAGCSEYDLNPRNSVDALPVPDIVITPAAIQFGEITSEEQEVQSFVIENVGGADLDVSDIVVAAGESSFTILTSERELLLAPGEGAMVDVAFTPMGVENYGTVHVLSNDPDTPEAPVNLLGYGAVPELRISPQHYTFGAAPIPCGTTLEVELSNVGKETLTITDTEYESGGLLTLDTSGLDLPLDLEPGESTFVTVTFAPVDVGADTGVLAVTSNDPRGVVEADQNGEGAYEAEAVEQFTEPGIPPVDVLFLIDQSCSMEGDNTDDIDNGIPDFIAELQTISDWQLLLVTEEDACSNVGILDTTTLDPATRVMNHAWDYSGGGTYYTESLLQLADMALAQTGPGQCNDGFLRPGALLHIIVASDEPERSGTPWSTWLPQLQSYAAAPELLKVSGIVDIHHGCGEGAAGYTDIANATGGALLNICNSNWGANMSDIASDVLAGMRTYNLGDPAIEGTIEVVVNGVATTDWEYSEANNSVTINEPPIAEGDVVDITYGIAALCE